METSPTEFLYDVFISYAREDAGWVMPNLYEPLIGCRARTGERARVYIDVGPEGLEPGVNWRDALASAIERTRVFLPVYSCTYFEKMNCRWELNHASNLDPTGERGRMSPLLIDPRAEQFVPSAMRQINHIPAGRDGWLAMICKRAGLAPDDTRVQLEFVDEPADAFVHHTLAPVTVRTRASNAGAAKPPPEEEITLSATSGDLSGTVVLLTIDGEATFDDLSIQTVESSTRLVATVQGCVPAESDEFAVCAAPRPHELGQQSIAVRDAQDVHFIDDGRVLAVITRDRAVVFGLDGQELSSTELDAPPRIVRRRGTMVGLALWSGTCLLLLADGQRISWRPEVGTGALTIPGDLALHDDGAYLGFWNGDVYSVGIDGDARVELELPPGIKRSRWPTACCASSTSTGGCTSTAREDSSAVRTSSGRSTASGHARAASWRWAIASCTTYPSTIRAGRARSARFTASRHPPVPSSRPTCPSSSTARGTACGSTATSRFASASERSPGRCRRRRTPTGTSACSATRTDRAASCATDVSS